MVRKPHTAHFLEELGAWSSVQLLYATGHSQLTHWNSGSEIGQEA